MNSSIGKHVVSVFLCFVLSLSLLSGCGNTSSQGVSATINKKFDEFTTQIFEDEVVSNMINLHYTLQDPASYGIDDYVVTLGDLSKKTRKQEQKELKKTLKELKKFSYSSLSENQQLTYDILIDYLGTQEKLAKYELYQEVLMPSNGIQSELPILFAEYSFQTKKDVDDYIEMISCVDTYFESIIDFEKEKAKNGLFMNDESCNKILEECEELISGSGCNYLFDSFQSKISKLNDLSLEEKEAYIKENEQVIEDHFIPGYKKLIDGLTELMGSGINDLGLYYVKNGRDYYQLLVYSDTGNSSSIEDLDEMITDNRRKDLLTCTDLARANTNLTNECMNLDWNACTPEEMITTLQDQMQQDFPKPPDSTYSLNYVEDSLQDYLAPAFYITAPIDNYEQNSIYINPASNYSGINLFTTLAHEGYPGHLYQTIMTYHSGIAPVRSLLDYSGYIEGWATYVEMQSYYYAGLEPDTASYLQHYQSAILSLYASSDIGIHYYGWTQDDLAKFWENYGITDPDTIKEITGFILNDPGDYLKYYIGYCGFLNLKSEMQETYGDDFSILDFHNAILSIGPAPFSILEKYFDKFYDKSPQTSSTISQQCVRENLAS